MIALAVSWLLFPLVLGLLCAGCGLLLEQAAGAKIPRALLLPAGFAVMVVAGVLTTTNATTAPLTTPLFIMLAVAGVGLSLSGRLPRVDGWSLAAGLGGFAVFGAPVILSGQATFLSYITLDDTATWLGMTDRLLTHGRTLTGLPPSTYQAALDWYWNQNGYPVGAFPPLGVVHILLRTDSAWLVTPYISFSAGLLALGLYGLAARLIDSRPLRALVAFIAAQPALLYGYAIWGGVKEVPATALVVLIAALAPGVFRQDVRARAMLPLAVAAAALVAVLNFGGVVWLVPLLVPVLVAGIRLRGRAFGRLATAFTAAALALSAPALLSASGFLNIASTLLTKESELGNLVRPISLLQVFGIWPVGDFRFRPGNIGVTYALIAVAIAAAAAGIVWASRRRAWEVPLYVGGTLVGCAVAVAAGSPWVDAKALAIASPAVLLAAMIGAVWLFTSGRGVEAAVVTFFVATGVLWSNALAYHEAWLAPRPQLRELETIGKRFAGDGPTLMTEYQTYGVRHFLRDMAPEAPAELRFRPVLLLDGQQLPKGQYRDIDGFLLDGILVYKTLVLPHSPLASRPPSRFELVWSGSFYDVWQQTGTRRILEHLPLGGDEQPSAVPRCGDVLRLGKLAAENGGQLAAVIRPQAAVISLAQASFPSTWHTYGDHPDSVYPSPSGTLTASVDVPSAQRYGIWLAGSFRRSLNVSLDGRHLFAARHQLNHDGIETPLGAAQLQAGRHDIVFRYTPADLRPGSGHTPLPMGPLVLSAVTDELPVTYVSPTDARSLCGKSLDWVEAVAG